MTRHTSITWIYLKPTPIKPISLKQLSRIRYLRGDNKGIIEKYEAGGGSDIDREAQNLGTKSLDELVEMLFYARALWAENRWDEALAVYDGIYLELNKRISESMLDLKKTPEYKTFNPRSFWEDLLYSPEDEEHLDVLMSPFHFVQIPWQ